MHTNSTIGPRCLAHLSYDHPVSQREQGPGRQSDVLDAILGKVADNRTRTETSNALFRAKALDQLDIAADIDNQLPLVSRRNWLLLVGAVLIMIAFLTWAALTPATQTVAGQGRVLANSGLLSVTSPTSGFVLQRLASSGQALSPGDTVALIQTSDGQTSVSSFVGGTIWQVAVNVGASVGQGEIIATVLPDQSEKTALIVLDSAAAEPVQPGMKVNANGVLVGSVADVEPPLPAIEVMQRTGISVPLGDLAAIVEVALDEPSTPGQGMTYTIELTSQTVLEQMLSR